jgi:hypothetical protein
MIYLLFLGPKTEAFLTEVASVMVDIAPTTGTSSTICLAAFAWRLVVMVFNVENKKMQFFGAPFL